MGITSNANAKGSDIAGLVATIDPDVYTAAAYTSDWVDVSDYHAFMATVFAGTLGTSATLDCKIQQATDSSGTGAKDISGKAITQLVKATDDDKQAVINVWPDELDINNSFNHIAIVMTVGTATSDAGASLHGFAARHGPASNNDLASVAEIVT